MNLANLRNSRAYLSWVILIGALSIPGALFVYWRSQLHADRDHGMKHLPTRGGVVFASPPESSRRLNSNSAASPDSVKPEQNSDLTQKPAPTAEPRPDPVLAEPTKDSSTLSLARDPMLSPSDLLRIKQEEENQQRATADMITSKSKLKTRNSRAISPETLVDLQGIISNQDGLSKAIVNNQVVAAGEWIGSVRILKIADSVVVFEYKGKKFKKQISKD